MKLELLIIYYVSLLNSLIIERRWNDRIFGITEDQCEDISFWKKRKYFCECSKKYGTLLSGENDQYKCNNEGYLGRLIWILKVLFVINDGKTMQKLLIVRFTFACLYRSMALSTKPCAYIFSSQLNLQSFFNFLKQWI